VKTAGFNFIRGSHYPKDPAFADACDQQGVLLWSENNFWGAGASTGEGSWATAGAYPNNAADQAPFETSVTNSLTDMIRVHRNHPSIVAWSMCNEVFATASATIPQMRALLSKEVALTHQLDPTRPAAIGGAQRPEGATTRIDLLGDIAGYNGDGATIGMFQNPGIPSLVTEYGSVPATRPGAYDPGWGNLSATLTNGFPTEYPWRAGQARWCAFDYGTHYGATDSTTGIVDYFRLPKRAWYWYRNAYASVPPPTWPVAGTPAALQLTADKTTLVAVNGTDDAQLIVTVLDSTGAAINNDVPVTLSIVSGPGEFPTGPSITFTPPGSGAQSDIQILDGQAAIEFRSYYAGTTVIQASSPGLTPATMTIVSQGSPTWEAGVTPSTPARPYSRYSGAAGQ
jgi:beta-galactosidase